MHTLMQQHNLSIINLQTEGHTFVNILPLIQFVDLLFCCLQHLQHRCIRLAILNFSLS